MTSPFGVNVLSNQELGAYASVVDSAVILFLNDVGGAINYKRGHPACKVISRIFDGHEDVMHRVSGATLRYLQQRAAEIGGADVYVNNPIAKARGLSFQVSSRTRNGDYTSAISTEDFGRLSGFCTKDPAAVGSVDTGWQYRLCG